MRGISHLRLRDRPRSRIRRGSDSAASCLDAAGARAHHGSRSDQPSSIAWELFDFGMNRLPRNDYTDAVVWYLNAMQTPEGYWSTNESRRPPMNVGEFQAAALAIYSLKTYGMAVEKTSTEAAIARAVAWLERAKPSTTQDRAFHLLGLAWGGGSPRIIKQGAAPTGAISSYRRRDGMGCDGPGARG